MLASKASPAALALLTCFTTVRSKLVMITGVDRLGGSQRAVVVFNLDYYEGKEEG